MYRFEKLTELQIPLVNKFYKQARYSSKAGRGEVVFVLKGDAGIVAAVRLEPKPNDAYFLRAMCVLPELREKGVGTQLLVQMQSFLNAHSVYCFPFDHLVAFYGAAGFKLQETSKLPSSIVDPFSRYQRQGRKICIMCNAAFIGDLAESPADH
ncbi:MAG: GNAT family N-acetyltransferase [Cellvibrionaceae bacterium]